MQLQECHDIKERKLGTLILEIPVAKSTFECSLGFCSACHSMFSLLWCPRLKLCRYCHNPMKHLRNVEEGRGRRTGVSRTRHVFNLTLTSCMVY